jgi:molybdenum cofactor guanylyltransferase
MSTLPRSSAPRRASGAVLAGGRSRRLGRDKRALEVDGVPLLTRSVRTLATLVDDVVVVIAHDEDPARVTSLIDVHARVVADARADHGPAAGLEVALATARHEHVLVVAGDHPDLEPSVLELLLDTATGGGSGISRGCGSGRGSGSGQGRTAADHLAVALEGTYGAEPLLAVYRVDALPLVRAALDEGVRRLQDVLARLEPWCVPAATWRALDADGRTLADLDTPSDVAAREQRRA